MYVHIGVSVCVHVGGLCYVCIRYDDLCTNSIHMYLYVLWYHITLSLNCVSNLLSPLPAAFPLTLPCLALPCLAFDLALDTTQLPDHCLRVLSLISSRSHYNC